MRLRDLLVLLTTLSLHRRRFPLLLRIRQLYVNHASGLRVNDVDREARDDRGPFGASWPD